MGFFSSIGSSALGGAFSSILDSANSFHSVEAGNKWTAAIDPAGYALGRVQQHGANQQMKSQLKYADQLANLEYSYQKQAALEMPSLIRQGYEDAGYNALLALGQTGAATAAPKVQGGDTVDRIPKSKDMNPLLAEAIANAHAQREKVQEETNTIKTDRKLKYLELALEAAKAVGAAIGFKALAKKYGAAFAAGAGASAVGRRAHVNLHLRKLSSAKQGAEAVKSSASALPVLPSLGKAGAASAAVVLPFLISEARKYAEGKYGKLPDATDTKHQEKNPRFRSRTNSRDYDAIKRYKW